MSLTNHEQTEPITTQCPDATRTTSPSRTPVMYLPLWLFSVNSALSWPSILRGHWCWSKDPQCQPLSPNLPCGCYFPIWCAMCKRNVSPPHRTNPSLATTDVTQRERGAIHLSCIRDCGLVTYEKTPSACLSTSKWKKKKKRQGKPFCGERSSEDRVRYGCFLPASMPSIIGLL